jgi:hypothetical protein
MSWTTGVQFVAGAVMGFFFTISSRPALGPAHLPPPVQWVSGALSSRVKRPGSEADRSLHLVPRLRMRGPIPPLPECVFMAWCFKEWIRLQGMLLSSSQEQLYMYLTMSVLGSPK